MAKVMCGQNERRRHGLARRCGGFSTLSSPNVANARPAPSSPKTSVSLIGAKRLVANDESLRGITPPEALKRGGRTMEVANKNRGGATVVKTENPPQRKFALTRVSKGDYLLPSNDGQTWWRIHAYDEDGSATRGDTGEPIIGRFWACSKFKGAVSNGRPVLYPVDMETFLSWDQWALWESNLSTRQQAIDAAMKASQ